MVGPRGRFSNSSRRCALAVAPDFESRRTRKEMTNKDFRGLVSIGVATCLTVPPHKAMAPTGTISKEIFFGMWEWKGAMRVIGHVRIEQ